MKSQGKWNFLIFPIWKLIQIFNTFLPLSFFIFAVWFISENKEKCKWNAKCHRLLGISIYLQLWANVCLNELNYMDFKLNIQSTFYILMPWNPLLQGDPNQNLLIQMAITLKICISDPKLVKPKCVSEAWIYFSKL